MRNGIRQAVGISFLCLLLVGIGLLVMPNRAEAASVEPILIEGNATCGSLDPAWVEFHKVEPVTDAGVWPAPDADMRITWVVDGEEFDWTSTFPIMGVFVKGGPDGNLYRYVAGSMGDTGLHAPANSSGGWAGLSHISFCYVPEDDEGSITVEKVANRQGSFRFQLYGTGGLLTDDRLIDSGSGYSWTGLESGNYSIHELLSAVQVGDGWEFISLTCRNEAGADEAQVPGEFDPADPPGAFGYRVELSLDPGEHITCVFENAIDQRSITVRKVANLSGLFDFTLVPTQSETVGDTVTLPAGGEHMWLDVTAGVAYSLFETVPAGWSLTDVTCNTEFERTDSGVEFLLGEANVVCTFTDYKKPPDRTTTTTTTAPPLGAIGDFVWEDSDGDGLQDSVEKGVEGFVVDLYDATSGLLLAFDITDETGSYWFADLEAGNYYLVFSGLEDGMLFTMPDQGANDTDDSDVDEHGRTVTIVLDPGEVDPSWDAGVLRTRVLPQVITTSTTAETLPFTGPATTPSLAGLALALLAFGGMTILSLRRREDMPIGGWSARLPEVL